MKAVKLQLSGKTLLNPAAPQWGRAPREHLSLRGTEAGAQPSAYVRTAWAGRRIGSVRSVSVQAAHNRVDLFFRLEWDDATHNPNYGDGSVFPDAAAVLFPANGPAPLAGMGSPGAPVVAWRWRANHPEQGESLIYTGLASEEPRPSPSIANSARWQDGRWSVVIGAPIESAASLESVAFAIWDGGNQERAGLHSVCPDWQELRLE